MPILANEPSLFPETLLESPGVVDGSGSWMALYTKPRQEKSLARELLRRSIPFYLPLVKKTLRYGRRHIASYAPLFGGYVFLFGSDPQRTAALTTNRVITALPVVNGDQLLTDLRQIRQLIAANVPLTIESRLDTGMRVRVRTGPLAGVEGVVLRRRAESRLLVSVNFLQQGASVEIDDFCLEPLD